MNDVIMAAKKIVEELHTVADELEGFLPPEDISNFRVLIEHNEVGVGIEMLLTQICEYDIVLSKKSYNILKNAVAWGNIDANYLDGIESN